MIKIGDLVYLTVNPVATGDSTKLQLKRRGPLVVLECLPNDTYYVGTINQNKKIRRYTTAADLSQLPIQAIKKGARVKIKKKNYVQLDRGRSSAQGWPC